MSKGTFSQLRPNYFLNTVCTLDIRIDMSEQTVNAQVKLFLRSS